MSKGQAMKQKNSKEATIEESLIYPGDEISLVDLWQILRRRKKIIATTLVAALLMAVGYLWLTPPLYEAKLRLFMPKEATLILSRPGHPFTQFEPKVIFQGFQNELKSSDRWRRFVSAYPDLFPDEYQDEAENYFEKVPVNFGTDKFYSAEHILISYQDNSSRLATDILQAWLQFTREEYVTGLIDQINVKIQRQRENIKSNIAMLRQEAKLKNHDRIARLREDLAIASALDITENILLRPGSKSAGAQAIITTSETAPGYLRGTKALNTEINVLLGRKSADPWISGLPEKQTELARLDNLQFIPDEFIPYNQGGEVEPSKYPVHPKKILVMMLAMISGLILGVFGAFFKEFYVRVR